MAELPLDELRAETFTPHLGSQFEVVVGAGTLPFLLTEAKTVGAPRPGAGRAPFGLTFRGPGRRVLPQATYRLEHPLLGAIEIFLVPVGKAGDGFLYEAIFN